MTTYCSTCNARVCPTCEQALTHYSGGSVCFPCAGKILDEAERKPSWAYHTEIRLWDGYTWQYSKLSEKFGVWYGGDWRTNYRLTGDCDHLLRPHVELTEEV